MKLFSDIWCINIAVLITYTNFQFLYRTENNLLPSFKNICSLIVLLGWKKKHEQYFLITLMVQPKWLKFIKMNKNVLSATWLSEMFNCAVSPTDIKKVFLIQRVLKTLRRNKQCLNVLEQCVALSEQTSFFISLLCR